MSNTIKNQIKILFSKAHDTATEQGRAKERARKITQSAVMGMLAKCTNVATGLITVPLTLPYLGLEQFGIWMALTGLIAFLAFSDFGLSIGLQSKLTQCHGNDDRTSPISYISTTLILVIFIALLISFCAILTLPLMDFSKFIHLSDPANNDVLQQTALFVVVIFAMSMPAALIQRIFDAYQLGAVVNGALALGRLLGLLSVYLSVSFQLSLSYMVAFYMSLPFLMVYLASLWLFYKHDWMRPHFSKFSKEKAFEVFSIGKFALSAQFGAIIMSSGPLLVLTNIYGAIAIVPYSVAQRVLGIISMVLFTFLTPLWPAYGEALARKDYRWIKKVFRKSVLISLSIFMPSALLLVVFGQNIIYLWAQNIEAVPSLPLLIACTFWALVLTGIRVFSMLLNGVNKFKGQGIYGLILPVIALLSGIFFSNNISLISNLMLMILIGDFLKLLCMWFETQNLLNTRLLTN